MTRKLLSVACAAIVAGVLGFSQAKASTNITYDLNYTATVPPSALPGTVSGFIETNGTIGTLASPTDFVDWNITINVNGTVVDLLGPLSGNNSSVGCCSSTTPVTATATTLSYAFGSGSTGGFFDFGLNAGGSRLCYTDVLTEGCGPIPSSPSGITWQVANGTLSTGINPPSDGVIATIATTATPAPAALPLFASGIGGLGLLGWRRKRKAQPVA